MSGYSWVAVISLFFYVFLLLTFLASKKSKKVIRTFIALLGIMILWNGGSFGMRMQLWPSSFFWHHVSLLGMMMVTVVYFHFTMDFLEEKNGNGRWFWTVFYLVLFVINCFTGFFVPLPEVQSTGGHLEFLYHYSWHIYVLLGLVVITLAHLTGIIYRHCKGNRIAFQQLLPVVCGLMIMLLGHSLATLEAFVGLPVDMVSGVVNALFLFYALYKKRLFRMTILFSKSNYCIFAMVLGVGLFSNFALVFQRFLMQEFGMGYSHSIMMIALVLIIMIAILYVIINALFDAIFVRTEHQQSEMIAHFSEEVTHMMSMSDILKALSDTLQEAIGADRLFVLIHATDGHYRIEHTTNPLEEKNFYIRADHPLVSHLKTHNGYILFQDFSRSTMFRSMWEKEKSVLTNLHIECFAPLMCDDELIGIIMVSRKSTKTGYKASDLNFLQSISNICAIAINNAYSYERALEEVQKDDLTQLISRKYFFELLSREFEKCQDNALSLCLINLDDFKLYNQLYGVQEGNIALQRVAGILSSAVNGGGYAARISGKEFALILPGYDIYSAKCLADNVSEQIRRINQNKSSGTGKALGQLTASVGICAAPYIASTAKELFRNADNAVYTVKRNGKNAVLMYSAEDSRREDALAAYKSGYTEHANTIYALTAAIDAKDHYTFQHSQNVAHYASALAKAANMSPEVVEVVKEAGLLHDIGKIGIHEEILNKPGKLSTDEYETMKDHVENAVNIIRNLPSLDYVIPAVLSHHERYDGRGYPRRLAGEDIPITGRILSIADAFDAITSDRSYKEASSAAEAVNIIRAESGKQFDPMLAGVFTEMVERGELSVCSSGSGETAPVSTGA